MQKVEYVWIYFISGEHFRDKMFPKSFPKHKLRGGICDVLFQCVPYSGAKDEE